MTPPEATACLAALEATWPAAERTTSGPFTLRRGLGGGQRVSAATATGPAGAHEIAAAERAMAAWGQAPIFMIRPGEEALDAALARRGYAVKDPVTLYAAAAGPLGAPRPQRLRHIRVWPPVAVQAELWEAGGIGPGRLAVMDRAAVPRVTLLGRIGQRSAGVAYVGACGDVAMLHALEVAPAGRRQGLGRDLMRGAALWAVEQGAAHLTVVVTDANHAANALYRSLGMVPVTRYHYRVRPQESP